jgi:hypothetical protein
VVFLSWSFAGLHKARECTLFEEKQGLTVLPWSWHRGIWRWNRGA